MFLNLLKPFQCYQSLEIACILADTVSAAVHFFGSLASCSLLSDLPGMLSQKGDSWAQGMECHLLELELPYCCVKCCIAPVAPKKGHGFWRDYS